MIIRDGGVNRTITTGEVQVGSAIARVTRVLAHVNSVTETVATLVPSLSLAITPEEGVNAFIVNGGQAVTGQATATPTGGSEPYTYQWERIGSGISLANSPNSASTTFQRQMQTDEAVQEQWRCTVTDDQSATATDTVDVTFVSVFVDDTLN